jgi:hypothetical protein
VRDTAALLLEHGADPNAGNDYAIPEHLQRPHIFVEKAMQPSAEPSRTPPPPQQLPETELTAPSNSPGTPDSTGPDAVTPPVPPPCAGPPEKVGRYRIASAIARGGVGIVLRAHDDTFNRTLAVKVLQGKYRGNADGAARFLEEAQVMGQLQHPGIPPVYDLGEMPDGRPFFALKLIKGRTLAGILKERPDPTHDLPRFIAIFEPASRATERDRVLRTASPDVSISASA